MKKLSISLVLLFLLVNISFSQVKNNALGLRFGAGYGLGTEISFQHGLSSVNRLELNLGFNSDYEYVNDFRHDYNSWSLTGIYQWVWKIDNGFSWYAGPGGKIGTWSSMLYNSRYNDGMFVAAAGDIGIEYCFPARIQLALDARPEIGLINHGSGMNVGFSVRFQF